MTTNLRILIGCETSGVMRRAFAGPAEACADQWGGFALQQIERAA